MADRASRTSSSLNGLMTAVTSFMFPSLVAGVVVKVNDAPPCGLESLLDESGAGRFADVLSGDRIDRTVGVGVSPVAADRPVAGKGVGHACLPVGVVQDAVVDAVVVAVIFLATYVTDERPLVGERISCRRIQVPGTSGIGHAKGFAGNAVGEFQRQPLPRTRDVELGRIGAREAGVVAAGIEVLQHPDVQAPLVIPDLLPAAVDVPLEAA